MGMRPSSGDGCNDDGVQMVADILGPTTYAIVHAVYNDLANIDLVAGNIVDIQTINANMATINAAANSATAAQASADAAAASVTAATNAANVASASQTAAHTSEVNAATSATAAQTAAAQAQAIAGGNYEPTIAAGNAAQYWRGDKTWQILNASAVGLDLVTYVAGNADHSAGSKMKINWLRNDDSVGFIASSLGGLWSAGTMAHTVDVKNFVTTDLNDDSNASIGGGPLFHKLIVTKQDGAEGDVVGIGNIMRASVSNSSMFGGNTILTDNGAATNTKAIGWEWDLQLSSPAAAGSSLLIANAFTFSHNSAIFLAGGVSGGSWANGFVTSAIRGAHYSAASGDTITSHSFCNAQNGTFTDGAYITARGAGGGINFGGGAWGVSAYLYADTNNNVFLNLGAANYFRISKNDGSTAFEFKASTTPPQLWIGVNKALTTDLIGVANGIVPLGADSKIAAVYMPSYVDDVLEYANLASFPATGTSGIIYVADDTGKIYRWSGSTYIEISPSPGSTDSVTEGVSNLYFTNARTIAALANSTVAGTITATGTIKSTGELQSYQTSNTGRLRLGPTDGSRYLYYDGTGYSVGASANTNWTFGGYVTISGFDAAYNVGVKQARTGQVGYHMYNGGGNCEWLTYQPVHASGDEYRIATYVAGTATDRLKITPTGEVTAPGGFFSATGANAGFNFYARDATAGFFSWYNWGNVLKVYSSTSNGDKFTITANGDVWCAGNFSSASDRRLKKHITYRVGFGLQNILDLKPVTYRWKGRANNIPKDLGLIAQDVEEILPELVVTSDDGMKSVDYQKLSVVLIQAVKELTARVERLENGSK